MFILTFDEFVKTQEANVVDCNFFIEEDDGYEACSCHFIDGEIALPCQGFFKRIVEFFLIYYNGGAQV